MAQPNDLYSLVFPAPALSDSTGKGPVLIHGLEGFSDAGHAVRLATEHIRSSNRSELVARFNIDEFIDYRSRRPAVTYSFDHFADYHEPHLSLHLVTTADGYRFLLLSGLEPDLKWDAFTHAVTQLSADLGVRLAIGLGAMPLSVPHTRPAGSSSHSRDLDLLHGLNAWPGEFRLPGSADSLLEIKMAEQGFRSMGVTAHVPHYLAQSEYPAAAIRLVDDINHVSGLNLSIGGLEQAKQKFDQQLAEQVHGNHEVQGMVSHLERVYDDFVKRRRGPDSLTPGDRPLPTGEEIGAELEQFLAQHRRDDSGPEAPGFPEAPPEH